MTDLSSQLPSLSSHSSCTFSVNNTEELWLGTCIWSNQPRPRLLWCSFDRSLAFFSCMTLTQQLVWMPLGTALVGMSWRWGFLMALCFALDPPENQIEGDCRGGKKDDTTWCYPQGETPWWPEIAGDYGSGTGPWGFHHRKLRDRVRHTLFMLSHPVLTTSKEIWGETWIILFLAVLIITYTIIGDLNCH